MQHYIGTKFVKACEGPAERDMGEHKKGTMGMSVKYSDGYTSWSPKDVFDAAYRPIDNIAFGCAIEAIKKGKRVARKGWNGKGMYIFLETFSDRELVITMFTAGKTYQPGWLASQADILSDDWVVLD